MIKIMGIDPGLSGTGIGVIKGIDLKISEYSFGTINTSKDMLFSKRLEQIFSKLLFLLKDEKPDLLVVEDIFFLKENPKSGISLAKVVGVILLAACQTQTVTIEIPVREAKKILTGNGGAKKEQLEQTVRNLLGVSKPLRPYHVSDALALGIIGLYRYDSIKGTFF